MDSTGAAAGVDSVASTAACSGASSSAACTIVVGSSVCSTTLVPLVSPFVAGVASAGFASVAGVTSFSVSDVFCCSAST